MMPSTPTSFTPLVTPRMTRRAGDPRSICVCVYKTATQQQFTSGAAAATVNFDTKETDTHLAVTTGASWVFRAPYTMAVSGAAQIMWESTTGWATTEVCRLTLRKNAVDLKRLGFWDNHISGGSALFENPIGSPFVVYLEKGETLDVQASHTIGANLRLINSAQFNRFELIGIPL